MEKAAGDAIGAVLNQGVLGAICILLLFAVYKLYRENQDLLQRHITKAENFAEKQTQLADRVTAILESAMKSKG